MKQLFKVGLVLSIVCISSAAVLSFVFTKTEPLINQHKAAETIIAQKEVLKEAKTFKTIKIGEKELSVGLDDYGNEQGIVMKIYAEGYSGVIEMVAGINTERRLEGVKIIKQTETPGLGAKISEEKFTSRFTGKSSEELIIKKDGLANGIDAITGATISSKAVVKGLKENVEWLNINYYKAEKNDVVE